MTRASFVYVAQAQRCERNRRRRPVPASAAPPRTATPAKSTPAFPPPGCEPSVMIGGPVVVDVALPDVELAVLVADEVGLDVAQDSAGAVAEPPAVIFR